jgi:hypothetical protein
VVPLAPSRVEAPRRNRDTRARAAAPTLSASLGHIRRSRFDNLTRVGQVEPWPPATLDSRAQEAGEQVRYPEQAQATKAQTTQYVVTEARMRPQAPSERESPSPAEPSLESMMHMMAEAHAVQAKHMTDLTQQMTERMQAMEIAASAAEEIRIATAEAVREATAEAAREAAEQRALATAAATATAEAAAHEVGRQHQAYMRDLKRQ